MLKKSLAAFAALLACVSAHAQQAPAQQAPAQSGLVDAAHFVAPAAASDAHISPNGAYIAYIGRDASGEFIVVVDLATHRGARMQDLPAANGFYNWLEWKGDNKLILSASLRRTFLSGTAAPVAASQNGSGGYQATRVFSMDRSGTSLVQMFQGQASQLYGFGSMFLLDDLPTDPTHVLLEANDSSGIVSVWRADIGTGAIERIETGIDLTDRYWTDLQGAIVMREDVAYSDSNYAVEGYKFFRRAPGAHDWTFVTQVRGAATATNTPDFEVVTAGPQPGKLYVFARPNGQDLSSLYLYDTASNDWARRLRKASAPIETISPFSASRAS